MGIFFLTKLTKIPIYRLEKKAARLISGRIEKKNWYETFENVQNKGEKRAIASDAMG